MVFKQTFENTVQNSVTVKISGPTKKKSEKKVRVKFVTDSSESIMSTDNEQEMLINWYFFCVYYFLLLNGQVW